LSGKQVIHRIIARDDDMKFLAYMMIILIHLLNGCSSIATKNKPPEGHVIPEVHVIGVYEGWYPDGKGHSFGYHPYGNIDIIVHEEKVPVILILTSYEPVTWTFKISESSRIEKVILSGYHPSKTAGLPNETTILKKDIGYAYSKDSRYRKIEEFSLDEFGIIPSSFQYGYKGNEFFIQ